MFFKFLKGALLVIGFIASIRIILSMCFHSSLRL